MPTRAKPKSGARNWQDGQFRRCGWSYRQSQFPAGPEVGAGRRGVAQAYSAKRTQFGPGVQGLAGPIVRNKPNFHRVVGMICALSERSYGGSGP